MTLRLPGKGRDLHRGAPQFDAGPRPRRELAARKPGDNRQRYDRGQDIETQHDPLLARHKPAERGLWLVKRKRNSLLPGLWSVAGCLAMLLVIDPTHS